MSGTVGPRVSHISNGIVTPAPVRHFHEMSPCGGTKSMRDVRREQINEHFDRTNKTAKKLKEEARLKALKEEEDGEIAKNKAQARFNAEKVGRQRRSNLKKSRLERFGLYAEPSETAANSAVQSQRQHESKSSKLLKQLAVKERQQKEEDGLLEQKKAKAREAADALKQLEEKRHHAELVRGRQKFLDKLVGK